MNAKLVHTILIAVTLSVTAVDKASAHPFDLDQSFDGNGILATDLDPSNFSNDGLSFLGGPKGALALQADGKIVAVGYTRGIDGGNALVRYLPNGALDMSFGTAGIVKPHITYKEYLADVVIQDDGKIVVAGATGIMSSNTSTGLIADQFVARYLTDGSLDPSFGSGGVVTTDLGGYESGNSVKLRADGKIVVAGEHSGLVPNVSEVLLVQYHQNGLLDSSFGNQGIVTTGYNGTFVLPYDMDITNDGRIAVVGLSLGPADPRGFLGRYLSNGAPDISLNGGSPSCILTNTCGKVVSKFYTGNSPYNGGLPWGVALSLRRQDGTEDGKIVVSGDFGIARYNSNGTLDTSFDGDGISFDSDLQPAQNLTGTDIAVRNDGKIIRVGAGSGGFGIGMYTNQGVRGCGGDITVTASFGPHFVDATSTIIQPDGRILASGYIDYDPDASEFDTDFALARYQGGECGVSIGGTITGIKEVDLPKTINKFVNPQDKVGPNWPGHARHIDELMRTGGLASLEVSREFAESRQSRTE